MNNELLDEKFSKPYTVRVSDAIVNKKYVISKPVKSAYEYSLKSIEEINEHNGYKDLVEIRVSGLTIEPSEKLKMFFEENGRSLKLHTVFYKTSVDSEKYTTSFLFKRS